MKKNFLTAVLIFTLFVFLTLPSFAAGSKAEVRKMWEEFKPKYTGTSIFTEEPSAAAPYKAGKLDVFYMQDGFNMMSFARFLASLPYDITTDTEIADLAQRGAVTIAANNQLSHFPSRPEGMDDEFYSAGLKSTGSANIYMSYGKSSTLADSVLAYLSDSDSYNISALGHRRWILNPPLKKSAFGAAFSSGGAFYSTLQVFDRSRQNTPSYEYIAWPHGVFPTNMFHPRDAWSISLNSSLFNKKDISDITVTLKRDKTGESWDFTSADSNTNGKYFTVNTDGYGVDFCVIFRPDNLGAINEESFTVEVKGLKTNDKKTVTKSYQVFFFHLDNQIKLYIGSPYMTAFGNSVEIDSGRGTVPIIKDERTYLPIRALVEAMGGAVGWDGQLQEIRITLGGKEIKFYVDSPRVIVNGIEQSCENYPFIMNERTYVPVRFVAENLNCVVDWNESLQEVLITVNS